MDKITLGTRKVSIEFPGVKALSDVDFEISTGMIHAVMGANGAGKSTLMKVLAGSNPDYTGDVLYNGNVVELRNPAAAKKLGIQIVYQEVDMALIPTLSVAENVMFNDMVMNMGHKQFVNYGKIRKDAKEALARLNIDIDVKRWCGTLTLAQKQMVLIARAVQNSCNFLILDEPTAPLSDTETEELFRVVKHLRETENIAIIFITHRIQEVLRICDSYTVMRNGQVVDTTPITPQTTSKEIVDKMLGRSFEENFPKEVCEIGEKSFVIDHLTERENRVKDVSMYVRKGEIVGLAGLVGAGKTELCKTIFGAYHKSGGTLTLNGRELKIKNPSDAVKNRIALVPEERRKEGVLVAETVTFNISAACLGDFCTMSFVNDRKTAQKAKEYVKSLSIKTPSVKQRVAYLSGGNQQQVVIGKWLARDLRVLLIAEPTAVIDIGAKDEIYKFLDNLAEQGVSILLVSSDLQELLRVSHRILVFRKGHIQKEFDSGVITQEDILMAASGIDTTKKEEKNT